MKPEAPSYHELIPGGFERCNNQTHTNVLNLPSIGSIGKET